MIDHASIVLPCCNKQPICPVVERYREVWEDLPAELILVDNGSTDDRLSEAQQPSYRFARMVQSR